MNVDCLDADTTESGNTGLLDVFVNGDARKYQAACGFSHSYDEQTGEVTVDARNGWCDDGGQKGLAQLSGDDWPLDSPADESVKYVIETAVVQPSGARIGSRLSLQPRDERGLWMSLETNGGTGPISNSAITGSVVYVKIGCAWTHRSANGKRSLRELWVVDGHFPVTDELGAIGPTSAGKMFIISDRLLLNVHFGAADTITQVSLRCNLHENPYCNSN